MEEKPITIWDIVRSISEGTEEVFDEKIYNPFIVTMAIGRYPDLVLIAQELNMRPNLTKRQHYDFLFNVVRKKKRFAKWPKKENDLRISVIQKAFGYSYTKALTAMSILTDQQLEEIENFLNSRKGGIQR